MNLGFTLDSFQQESKTLLDYQKARNDRLRACFTKRNKPETP